MSSVTNDEKTGERNRLFLKIFALVFPLYLLAVASLIWISDMSFASRSAVPPINGVCAGVDYQLVIETDESGKPKGSICKLKKRLVIENLARLGPVGDSFAIVNSVLGILSLTAILLTLFLQSTQLTEQRAQFNAERAAVASQEAELRRSSVAQFSDHRFFSWIELHHAIVTAILMRFEGVAAPHAITSGRQSMSTLRNVILIDTAAALSGDNALGLLTNAAGEYELSTSSEAAIKNSDVATLVGHLEKAFVRHRKMRDAELGHYFRNAYRLLKWIDGQEGLSEAKRSEYAGVFRAQLSFAEIQLMLLNCVTEPTGRAAPLFSKYAMFENLPEQDHIRRAYVANARLGANAFGSKTKE